MTEITAAQRRFLEFANRPKVGGVITLGGTRGLVYASRERMAGRLVEAGYLTPYVHGGWEITRAGKAALKAHPTSQGEVHHD